MANLWIRSQNKRKLTKVDNICYSEYRNSMGKHCFYIYCRDIDTLGEYSTEERCIEIIDEIQKLLLGANPKNAFAVLKNIEFGSYEEAKFCVERARKDNFFAYCDDKNYNVEFLQPNIIVYEMPEE